MLVDGTEEGMAVGRTHREAPEIDGVVQLEGGAWTPGEIVAVEVVAAAGPDLVAQPLKVRASATARPETS